MQWLPQTLLLGMAAFLAIWAQAPGAAVSGIGALWIALVVPEALPLEWREFFKTARLALAWAGSVTFASILLVWNVFFEGFTLGHALGESMWDVYFAAPAWLIAAAVWWRRGRMADGPAKERWKTLLMAWLLCGALMWLGGGYCRNHRVNFYGAILPTVALLIVWRAWFRLGRMGSQLVNTAILLLVGLPAADLLLESLTRTALRPETCRLYYSFKEAKGDPGAFRRWQGFLDEQMSKLALDTMTRESNSLFCVRLRPNSHGILMNCPLSINSKGFRGREIPSDKGNAYRIVALGESSTFGITLEPGQKTWPELLEEMIRERLKTRRPVEVINAGVPGYTILDSVNRLDGDILPLRPDLILSYHGANGFYLIDDSLLPPVGPRAPVYRERAVWLTSQAEHRLKMMLYRWRWPRPKAAAAPSFAKPLETPYAQAYRRLIQCARTNRFRLALADYSMPVNSRSEERVVAFYQYSDRPIDLMRRANAVHSQIVQQLAAEHPEVCLVDTHPRLDGECEKFIDSMHFTQEGRQQMAENMFAGIRQILIEDLGKP